MSPPFRHRGIVEGFYGKPWAHADRLWWIERLGALGMNTYVVAPKDDALQRERWREPYPPDELARFGELALLGREHGVRVGCALSPGLSIRYSDPRDVATLVEKLRAFTRLGAGFVALCLDDVPTQLAHAEDRAAFASLADAHVAPAHAVRDAVAPEGTLWLVPTDYAGSEASAYAETLGTRLAPEIEATGGFGAVMGAKNLKAVAVRGTRGFHVADPKRFKAIARDWIKKNMETSTYEAFSKVGTLMYLTQYHSQGRSVAKNVQATADIDYIDNYGSKSMMKHMTRSVACFGCPIHCKHEFKFKKGPYAGEEGHGTEFCIMSAHGPACGNTDEGAVLKINNICNEYVICGDTSGITLAAAFEWYQRGIITKEDTGGIDLRFGNADAMLKVV